MAKLYGEGSEAAQLSQEKHDQEQALRKAKAKKIKIIIGGGFLAIGLIFLGVNVFRSTKVAKESAELRQQITDARAELSALQQASQEGATVEEIQQAVYSASTVGERCCAIQNDLNELYQGDLDEDFDRIYSESQVLLEELRGYITANAQNTGEARGLWCNYPNSTWYFDGNFAMAAKNYPVVFTCYANDDTTHSKLLAYAVGMYDADTDSFSSMNIRSTTWLTLRLQEEAEYEEELARQEAEELAQQEALESDETTETLETEESVDEGSVILDMIGTTEEENDGAPDDATETEEIIETR